MCRTSTPILNNIERHNRAFEPLDELNKGRVRYLGRLAASEKDLDPQDGSEELFLRTNPVQT